MATNRTGRIDNAAVKQTIVGPGGLKVVLNADEIFPNNPGMGTPCMVELRLTTHGLATATFECAAAEAELECGEVQLTVSQAAWLREMSADVDAWLEHHTQCATLERA